jgi:hypothetical protein
MLARLRSVCNVLMWDSNEPLTYSKEMVDMSIMYVYILKFIMLISILFLIKTIFTLLFLMI